MKRFFFACSVVSLACASCGGAIERDPTQNTGTAPSGTSTTTPPKRPPGSSSSSSSGGFDDLECPQDIPLSAADLDKEIGWKSGKAANGSCSEADITTFEQNFKDTSIRTYFDLSKGLSAACKACAFSKDTDATWGPIVGTAQDNGETGFVNFGACFGVLESPACGEAVQYERFCGDVACNECATTSSELQKCVSKATDTGMCADFHQTTTSACPNLAAIAGSCGDLLKSVKTLCGSP